jgi:hypothetical protein
VALLIPVQKAYCSDRGFEACVLGQQVLGGHGYVAEWGLEQNVRDARIAQIYEGANGIQALDLMGRKTVRVNGEYLGVLLAEMEEFMRSQQHNDSMRPYLPYLQQAMQLLRETTDGIISRAGQDPNEVGSASYAYLELLGLASFCFMWQRILATAFDALARNSGDEDHLQGLVKTGEFFFSKLLPRSRSLAEEIGSGAASIMAMSAQQF